MTFDGNEFFMTQESFEAASDRHLIPSRHGMAFAWNGEPMYGWRVKHTETWIPSPPMPALERLERSIFRVTQPPE